jgi:hypothetical protein
VADNTNAQAIKVSNEKVRPACDKILQIYFIMKALQSEFTAQGWSALFPVADPTGEVKDGAATDGRTVVTNQSVQDIFTALSAFITHMEASTNLNLNRYLKAAVNPEPKS